MAGFSFQLNEEDADIQDEVRQVREEIEAEAASEQNQDLVSMVFDDAHPSMTSFREISLDVAKGNNEYSNVDDYMEAATINLDSLLR